ncbi:MAG: hypothetical protein ACF8PN_09405 [Phycisphaerales bacterium]
MLKYAIIIPEGAADRPLDDLDGLTPLQSATAPNTDRLARAGRVGAASFVPQGFEPDADVVLASLLGYDPTIVHPRRAAFESVAAGVELGANDWALAVSLVTLDREERLLDHTAGGLGLAETEALLRALAARLAEATPHEAAGLEFIPLAGHRALLVDRSGRDWSGVETEPPWRALGQPIAKRRPRGGDEGAALLNDLMRLGREVFAGHEVNRTRAELGEREATLPWFWGEAQPITLDPLAGRVRHQRVALLTDSDLMLGLAQAAGIEHAFRLPEPGGPLEVDPRMIGDAAVELLTNDDDAFDLVIAHHSGPARAALANDFAGKVAAIEAIDAHVVSPVADALEARAERGRGREGAANRDEDADPEADPDAGTGRWRLLIAPAVAVDTDARRPTSAPAPFLIAGHRIASVLRFGALTESEADESDLHIPTGHDLLEYFLFSGGVGR